MLDRLMVEVNNIVVMCGEYISAHTEIIEVLSTAMLYMFPFVLSGMFLYTVVGWVMEELQDTESLLHLTMLFFGVLSVCVIECLKWIACHMNPVRFYRIFRGKYRRLYRKGKKNGLKNK